MKNAHSFPAFPLRRSSKDASFKTKYIGATLLLGLFASAAAVSQARYGELRLEFVDPSDTPLQANVRIVSAANGYDKTFTSNAAGLLTVQRVPFGVYNIQVQQTGFALAASVVEVRSEVPRSEHYSLKLASVNAQITVAQSRTLVDPDTSSSRMEIGSAEIRQRLTSLPGRSIQDLVDSQPGWLYEGNAVLHPRGSEYQTQFVVDGIPLTDNRSPSFGPEIEAEDLESMSIYTAGYPAEYGRKLGGVVELNTRRQDNPGLHEELALSGGNYDTASGYGQLQEQRGRNLFEGNASGSMSSHYLNPVVPENFTNRGTTGDFTVRYERDLTSNDRISFNVRHELSRFLIPNELIQQQAGQIQNGDTLETLGTVRYQHILSPDSVIVLSSMIRDKSNDLFSNQNPTPIAASQHNHFREGYFKGSYSLHLSNNEFKAGVESDTAFLHENFAYVITDPTQFDEDTPSSLKFVASRPDLEQAAFIEDSVHLRNWTIDAGLRWDHYQLLLNRSAFSPRLSLGRAFPSRNMVVHASYDRIFQTPSSENILISSSTQINALSDQFLRLPVQPSRGNYYEGGVTQGLFDHIRLDLNLYRRDVSNFADDDQLLNTGVSYPIAFQKAVIYGAEGKMQVLHLHRLDGFVSYSYQVGAVWLPVTGGVFLGDDARNAASQLVGHFPDSQDQRNTLRTRFAYHATSLIWVAAGTSYGSGLPFEYSGDVDDAVAQYGTQVVDRLNFARGRIRPLLALNSSLGVDLYRSEKMKTSMQVDGSDLTNRLNVIDFGGLFSGNAIEPQRSLTIRLQASY